MSDPEPTTNPTMSRLEDQILWYDRKSVRSQQRFKALKMLQIVSAAAIPVAAGLHAPAELTGGLGALIVVLEGIQQLNQYHQNWLTYRSTCESLRHENYLYLGRAGPYRHARDPIPLLAN